MWKQCGVAERGMFGSREMSLLFLMLLVCPWPDCTTSSIGHCEPERKKNAGIVECLLQDEVSFQTFTVSHQHRPLSFPRPAHASAAPLFTWPLGTCAGKRVCSGRQFSRVSCVFFTACEHAQHPFWWTTLSSVVVE